MKKIFLYLLLGSIALTSCRKDPTIITEPELDAATQNSYDDQAAHRFLEEHYFDEKGNVQSFTDVIKPDSTHVKLSLLNPVTLPSGVVYIMRDGAQPTNGKTVTATDSIKIMQNAIAYKATKTDDDGIAFRKVFPFVNTISGSGIPEVDPLYYYVKQKYLNDATTDAAKLRSYYEIEGFKEALMKFQSFDIPDSHDYNLQGLIIVPSRAAFGKDPHFNYSGISFKDRSFIFNFQLYNTYTRHTP